MLQSGGLRAVITFDGSKKNVFASCQFCLDFFLKMGRPLCLLFFQTNTTTLTPNIFE